MRLFYVASLLILPCACSAATLRPVPNDKGLPVEVATLELPAASTAGTEAETLDLPEAPELAETYVPPTVQPHPEQKDRLTIQKPELTSNSVSPLYSLPVVGNVAVKVGAEKFN
ncbi:MAG: hypothetical protein V4734_06350, partial [Terriglobus sp.]